MNIINYDIIIIGGGPAGTAAAVAAYEESKKLNKNNIAKSILILEREKELGGILNQCIHNGFGLHTFKEELTGPEYADRFIKKVIEKNIEYKLSTTVLDISKEKIVTAINKEDGIVLYKAKAIILCMGCREKSRGALNILGTRPTGVYSAGTAQKLVNIEGKMPGKEVVILGSGDIGLIMARRMTLEGAKVKVVAELMPYSGGLKRNIVQCLDDYNIPLKLSHTVVDIRGKDRVESVVIAKVDENLKVIKGTEEEYKCDTLLLSVGLIPENELSKSIGVELSNITNGAIVNEKLMTSIDGVFAAGNVLHVHDLVDYVSEEATKAGENAVRYIDEVVDGSTENGSGTKKVGGADVCGNGSGVAYINIETANGVRYTVPQKINVDNMDDLTTIRFRVANVYKNKKVVLYVDDKRVLEIKKRILAPAEMEQVILKKADAINAKKIKLSLEEGD